MGYLVPKGLVGRSREAQAHARKMVRQYRKGAHLQEVAGPLVHTDDLDEDIVVSLLSRGAPAGPLVWLPMTTAELWNEGVREFGAIATQLAGSTWGLAALMGYGPSKVVAFRAARPFLRGFRRALEDLESVGCRYRFQANSRAEKLSRRLAPAVEVLLQGALGAPVGELPQDATLRELLEHFASTYEEGD